MDLQNNFPEDFYKYLEDNTLIEIKGVQQLDLISTVVEYEVNRQLGLITARDELTTKGSR